MLFKTVLWIVLSTASCSTDIELTRTCESVRIEQCRDIGYNVTGMPNFVGHDIQSDAQLQIQTFTPLIQYGCSSRLRFFLCSVYVPMCTEKVPQPIGPCRPLCEAVQGLCEPVLLEFGFLWPPALNCSQFPPVNNEKHMCMEGPQHEEEKSAPFRDRSRIRTGAHRGTGVNLSRSRAQSSVRAISRAKCKHLRASDRYYYINNTRRCAAACHADILYSKENKQFAQVWVAVWACLCFLSCMFTIATFFTNSAHFKYPERIIVILSWCYFIYSIAFLIRLIGGRNDISCYWDAHYGEPLLIQGGLDNLNCTIVFTLLYFFNMASYIWWLILTLSWFLTAGLRWNPEAMEGYGTYFHLVAWIVPAVKTIAILVLRAVDADELTGICYVGNQDSQFMVRFVLVPSFAYLALGVLFLGAGMIAVFRNKKYRAKMTSTEEKWELFMVRSGIFAILYTVPATCVLVANFYEYSTKDQWLAADSQLRPNVEVFTLKIFMSLVVGITTGVWLWTSRTPFWRRRHFPAAFCVKRPICAAENRIILLNGSQHKMTIV